VRGLTDTLQRAAAHEQLVFLCSFQKEESVIVDELLQVAPHARVVTIDTGVLFDHPDLLRAGFGGRLLPGYDFVSGDVNPNSPYNSLGTFLIATVTSTEYGFSVFPFGGSTCTFFSAVTAFGLNFVGTSVLDFGSMQCVTENPLTVTAIVWLIIPFLLYTTKGFLLAHF